MSVLAALAAIGVLAVLIAVHELGHFAAARLQGIHVTRFALGFGPPLLKYQGPETEYSIRAIPLGGYVAFPDDDPDSDIPADDPDLLKNRPILDRAIVISAGVIANLVFAYFLLIGQVSTIGFQNIQPGLVIPQVDSASAAQVAGVEPGDIVLSLQGETLPSFPDATDEFIDTIRRSPSLPITIEVQRGEATKTLTITPIPDPQGNGKIGVALLPNVETKRASNPLEALTYSAEAFERIVKLTAQGFWQLISNFADNASQVAGPVKIVEYGANIARADASNLFQFGALISINLAVINILPLPALDGGQLVFLIIEGLLGKPLPEKFQMGVMQTGLVLLLSLGVFLIVRDTLNLTFVQEFLPSFTGYE
ncbi:MULTISPECIES: RIP metalloprotease RseP [unclassified Synechocystis]|uniref:RIP metalloprotease RseP n=1 Tax=unclassified Synechocystis TaxID=2640012 RepID=UPI00048A756D|nr:MULTISPECIES: RIP metalloprotease RseP [unclassified Synechocystis]MCT0255162.1 RIP metalloprotease RseP [Synechocystis sp. CS-94]